MLDKEVMPTVCKNCPTVNTCNQWTCVADQRDACQKVLEAREQEWKEKRLEYEKDFTSQIVTHTRRELKVEFAEWLKDFIKHYCSVCNGADDCKQLCTPIEILHAHVAELRKEGK